ncbi:hypothetical protein PT2222_90344 [Paraburkholderia tropica]
MLASYHSRHLARQPDTLGNTAVFRIVIGRVRHQQALDGQLNRRQAIEVPRLADRLREAIAARAHVDEVVRRERGIDLHEVALHLVDERRIRLLILRMLAGHIERHVDDVIVERAQVRVLDDARNVHLGIVGVEPEVFGHALLELRDHAYDCDVLLAAERIANIGGQIGHHARHVGQRNRADHLVERMERAASLDTLDRAIFHHHFLHWRAETELAAIRLDIGAHAVEQRIRAAFEIAQLLAEQIVTRAPDAADAAPDPRGREVIRVVVKLVVEQTTPQHFPRLVADPAANPARCFDVVEWLPVVALSRKKRMQAVTELRRETQTLELEQRDGVAPRLHLALVEVAHLRFAPLHLVFDAELAQHLEESVIRNRVEVVVAFDRQAAEIETRGHAADAVVGFENNRLAAILDQLVSGAQAHRSRAEDGNAICTHLSSELQGDVAIGGIVERFVHGLGERRSTNAENAFPVDHLELVAGRQRLELIGRKRRVLVEQRVDLQQHIKEAVGDSHDRAACLRRALDLTNDVDVIDTLEAADVVRLALDPRLDAADDHIAEVAHVERLAHVFAAARNRKHRHAMHETREPAQVFAVEPSEHQRRAQHDTVDARGDHDLFLLALGFGVPVVGHGVHHGRADVHRVGNLVLLDGVKYVARCHDVVAHERVTGRCADLRLQHHHDVRAFEMLRPVARLGQVGVNRRDVRMHAAQDVEVRLELVEHDDIGVAARLESGHQILSDESGAAGKKNASLIHAIANKWMRFVSCSAARLQRRPLEQKLRHRPDDQHDQRPEPRCVEHVLVLLDGARDVGGDLVRRRDERAGQRQAGGHRRGYEAGLDRHDMGARLEQTRIQAFAERRKRGLRAAVQIVRWASAIACYRRDHRNRAALLRLDQIRDRREQADDRRDVGVEFADRDGGVGLALRLVGQGAGRNEHDVERAEFGLALREHGGVAIEVVDVEFVARSELRAARDEVVGDLLKPLAVTGHEEKTRALSGPAAGTGVGDGRGGADDQNVLHVRVVRSQNRDSIAGSRRFSSCCHCG